MQFDWSASPAYEPTPCTSKSADFLRVFQPEQLGRLQNAGWLAGAAEALKSPIILEP
jgi:hypothetical protein